MPEGKRFKEKGNDQTFYALEDLSFADVTGKGEIADLKFDTTYVCRLEDSTVYIFKFAKKNGKSYLKCRAEYTDKTLVTKETGVESEEELKKKEAKLLAKDGARTFAEKHKGWIYEVGQYKVDGMTKKLDDMIEDIEQEKTEEDAETTES